MRGDLHTINLICVHCSTPDRTVRATYECIEANHTRLTWTKKTGPQKATPEADPKADPKADRGQPRLRLVRSSA